MQPTENIRERFVGIANELSYRFPDLDLRFNLESGSPILRMIAPSSSERVMSLNLSRGSYTQLLYSAIFQIKELIQHFDA
jgi:hypothetical protein